MSEAQVEMSAKFIQQALKFCTNDVFRSSHRSATMSESEKTQIKNCFKKYVSAPNVLAPVLQSNSF